MKIRFLLFGVLLIVSFIVKGQVPSVILKLTDKDMVFSKEIPLGATLIDLTTNKQYLTLKTLPVGSATTIATCELLLLNSSNSATAHLREININGSAHHIGDLYLGGIIVSTWTLLGVEHGLIASLEDLPASMWNSTSSNYNTKAYGAYDMNDGLSNCNKIAHLSDGAVYRCLSYLGTSGWFLPSKFELWACYTASAIVNQILDTDTSGTTKGFARAFYWTSSELLPVAAPPSTPGAKQAFMFDFKTGQVTSNFKTNEYLVRPVKRY